MVESGRDIGVRNERLQKALKAYYRRALSVVDKERSESADDEFVEVKPRFRVRAESGWSSTYTIGPNWSRLISRSEDSLSQLEEHGSLVEALTADETIADHLEKQVWIPGFWGWIPGVDQCVERMLTELVYRQDGGFDEAAFEAFYEGVEEFFYGDVLEVRCLAPLGGFDMEADRIELNDGFSIVRISDAERAEMLSESAGFAPFVLGPGLGLRKHGLELFVEVPKHVGVDQEAAGDLLQGDPNQKAREAFKEACSAMRLFQKGEVGFDRIVSHVTCWHPIGGKMRTGPLETRQFFAGTYSLSMEEVSEFKEFWKRWREGRLPKKLEVAIRRFDLGAERRLPEDRLIDYMIGFESLLLTGDDRELGYRLSLRAAALLGETPGERAAIQNNVKKAYNVRSDIVHGRKLKRQVTLWEKDDFLEEWVEKEVTLNEFVGGVEDHLRSVVRGLRALLEKETPDEVIEGLDSTIARGFEADRGR